MPLSTSYVVRETTGNLRRNLVMTVAAIITMAVSLAALGAVLLMRQAIDKASVQWRGGVELAIFLQPTISSNESAAIGHELAVTPGVKKVHYVDQQAAYSEFRQIFGDQPDLVNVLKATDLPPSYRVVPVRAQDISQLGNQFTSQPGVLHVSYAQKQIHDQLVQSSRLEKYALILAVGVMLGAIALIINTIQLAIFARRREVAVMKLVGATNWFIRIPFMLEGLVHGLIGAGLAFAISYFARNTIASFVQTQTSLSGANLYVTPNEALLTGILVMVVGAAVGVLGSAFAVRRFLAV